MTEEEDWAQPFEEALAAVAHGDFDEIKSALEGLSFTFRQGKDANHWTYFHTLLRQDPIFKYPRNFYRPHGARRSSDRISKRDQSQAKQMIEALRGVVGSSQTKGGKVQ